MSSDAQWRHAYSNPSQAQEADVWIEISQMSQDVAPFCKSVATVAPEFGSSGVVRMSVQFNLTAYVKHLIEQA